MRLQYWCFGLFTSLAFLLPNLGQGFMHFIPIHPRIVSLSLAFFLFIWFVFLLINKRCGFFVNRKVFFVDMMLIVFFSALLIYYRPEKNIFTLNLSVDYRANNFLNYNMYKMNRIVIYLVPLLVAVRCSICMVCFKGFQSGFIAGTITSGLLALLLILINYDKLASSNYAVYLSGMERFSTIDLSLSLLYFMAVGLFLVLKSNQETGKTYFNFALLILCLTLPTFFLLAQRTAMMISLLMCVFTTIYLGEKKPYFIIIIVSIVVVVYVAYLRNYFLSYTFQFDRVDSFLSGNDNSVAGRFYAWGVGWEYFLKNPLGYGLGSFPRYCHGMLYPHNVLIEALFELGVFGALPILGLAVASVIWLVVNSFKVFGRFRNLALLIGFAYAMKCGDFSAMAPWVIGLYFSASINNNDSQKVF